jgi:hypothetical protein
MKRFVIIKLIGGLGRRQTISHCARQGFNRIQTKLGPVLNGMQPISHNTT